LLSITMEDFPSKVEHVMGKIDQINFIEALYACPNGVIAWSKKMKNLVETSTNLASVKFIKKNKIIITTSQRSSVNSSKYDISRMVESVFNLLCSKVRHSEGYPGWNPDTKSEILQVAKNSYNKLFKKYPRIRATHAGLECGLFLSKYHDLEMISIGPTVKEVHSPGEKLNIKSVEKYWGLLIEILKNIPEK
jgi:dipeptidase D